MMRSCFMVRASAMALSAAALTSANMSAGLAPAVPGPGPALATAASGAAAEARNLSSWFGSLRARPAAAPSSDEARVEPRVPSSCILFFLRFPTELLE